MRLLLSAADRAFKSGKSKVLQGVFKSIVKANTWLFDDERKSFWCQTLIVIIRVIIKLSYEFDNVCENDELLEHVGFLRTSVSLLESWHVDQSDKTHKPTFEAEATWLYRTLWNMGKTVAMRPKAPLSLCCELYELCARVLKLASEDLVVVLTNLMICSFLVTAGRLELCRFTQEEASIDCLQKAKSAIQDFKQAKEDLGRLNATADASLTHKMLAFECEAVLLELQLGVSKDLVLVLQRVQGILSAATLLDAPARIFQRMADLAMRYEAPSSIVFVIVRAALEAEVKVNQRLDLTVFSHWFRILVKAAGVNGSPNVQLELFSQAIAIIKSNGMPSTYPEEEIQWLQITAWNRGCEYFSAKDKAAAKLWCETSLQFAEYLPTQTATAQTMRQSYAAMLNTTLDGA